MSVYIPSATIELRKAVEVAKANLADLEAELAASERGSMVKCEGCGKISAVGDLIYIQTYWYVEPHGCTGGDYWKAGEGQFKCPHCEEINRLYDRPEVVELKPRFKAVKDHREG